MKQAQRWLVLALALTVLPTGAYAQKKPQAKPAATAKPTPGPKPPAAPAPTTDIEIDDPNVAKPAETTTPTADSASTSPGGGICDIDPTACPKASDIAALGSREVAADVYAVQQIYALRRHRFELNPYWSTSLNDQFVSHPGPGLAANFYLTNVLAVGVNGTYYQPFNGDADFNFEARRATRLAVPLNEYLGAFALNFTYVPIYGKFSGFRKFIFHYDGYVVGGVGGMFTRPYAVIDSDNRKFDYELRATFNAGFGLRVFFNRWFAITGEIRDYIYQEQVENTTVANTQVEQQNRKTWIGETPITHNVQAQVGLSIFFPFSWEYRLPK